MSEGIRKGTKVSDEEAKKLDRTQMGIAITGEPEVEGQDAFIGRVECPWCGNVGRAQLDSDHFKWFSCGSCGRAFKA